MRVLVGAHSPGAVADAAGFGCFLFRVCVFCVVVSNVSEIRRVLVVFGYVCHCVLWVMKTCTCVSKMWVGGGAKRYVRQSGVLRHSTPKEKGPTTTTTTNIKLQQPTPFPSLPPSLPPPRRKRHPVQEPLGRRLRRLGPIGGIVDGERPPLARAPRPATEAAEPVLCLFVGFVLRGGWLVGLGWIGDLFFGGVGGVGGSVGLCICIGCWVGLYLEMGLNDDRHPILRAVLICKGDRRAI